MADLHDFLVRFVSRWVVLAVAVDLVMAVVDASMGRSSALTTIYLVPPLAIALVENGQRAAVVACISTLLALASGAWDHYFLTSTHLYRLVIVAGSGVLAVVGAVFRTRAVHARDRMELLGEIARIADGRGEIEQSLHRLADLLVPTVADVCEIVTLDDGDRRRCVTRVIGAEPGLEQALAERLANAPLFTLAPDEVGLTAAKLVPRLGAAHFAAGQETRELVARLRMRSGICAPVRASDKTLAILALAVGPSGRRYKTEDLRFVRTVASRAALAIENARLVGELQEAQKRLEAIVGSLADAVTIRDVSGRLVYANDAGLQSLGFASVQEMRDREPRAIFGQYTVTDERGDRLRMEDLPSVRLLRGEQPEPLLLRYVQPDTGEEYWRLLKATPLYDARGKLEAAVTIIEDVTATKRAELQTRFLSRASEILASSLDYEETLRNVAWLAVPEIADWCAVDLVDERGLRQQVVAAHPDPDKLALAERIREYEPQQLDPNQGLGAVMRTGRSELYPVITPEMLEAAARSAEHVALLRELQMRSVLIVPMRAGARILGAMSLVNAESGRQFTEDDVRFAEQIAARAAVAVENSRLYTQRSLIATTLQQSLLPDALPQIDGWEIASLYRPASAGGGVEVGGDFYDAFPSDRGWVMLIGDVTGKGVQAAAMTSLVRYGARFVGEHLPDPAQILARLDSALRQQPTLSLCSALCMRIEADRITLASAGHPLPLVVTDDGVRSVGKAGSVLGAFPDGEWPTEKFVLRPDEVLLLYTDGVTDTVGPAGRFGEQRLRQKMAECGPLASEELLSCLDKALSEFQVGAQADDTAALALRLETGPVPVAQVASRREAS